MYCPALIFRANTIPKAVCAGVKRISGRVMRMKHHASGQLLTEHRVLFFNRNVLNGPERAEDPQVGLYLITPAQLLRPEAAWDRLVCLGPPRVPRTASCA